MILRISSLPSSSALLAMLIAIVASSSSSSSSSSRQFNILMPALAFQLSPGVVDNRSRSWGHFGSSMGETLGGHKLKASSALKMSSIPEDNENDNNINLFDMIKNSLPPAPEDQIALSGDMVALFVYTYLDHTVNEMYADTAAKMDVADLVAYDPNNLGPALPVWFDPTHLQTFGTNWLANTHVQVPYAPAIAASGLAFVSMATCWIICGYFSGAFLTRNTLDCDTSKAMAVTFKTWVGMCGLMVGLAWGSDALWGLLDVHFNALSAPARGGLTKADADFIFDSLTVLAWWRFMFNWLMGYGK